MYQPMLYSVNWGITPPDIGRLISRIKKSLGTSRFQDLKKVAENSSSQELISVIDENGLLPHVEDQSIFKYHADRSVSVRNTFRSILLNS